MSLNKVILMGRLTKEPEIRYTTTNKPVAGFSLAVDRDYDRQQTDFFECVAWNATAEFVQKWFHKGDLMVVSGRLQQREYTTKDGQKRTVIEVNCENVYFGGSKRSESNVAAKPVSVEPPKFEEMPDDGDLPF